jgi:ribosome-associated toxin RatA of RatAB toxin-antitoxin module
MATTTCQIEVHAQPELLWSVLWDVERYPEFISDCVDASARALPSEPGLMQQRVDMRVQLIRPLHYSAVMTGERPTSLAWAADDTGGYLQQHSGGWTIEASTDRRTCMLAYELTVAFSLSIPDAVIRRFADLNLPTMLRQVKARAEMLARKQET